MVTAEQAWIWLVEPGRSEWYHYEDLKRGWLAEHELQLAGKYGAPVRSGEIDWDNTDDETAGILGAALDDLSECWDADPRLVIRAWADDNMKRPDNEVLYVPRNGVARLLGALLADDAGPAAVAEGVTTTTRMCACGCGQPVTSPRPEARYATGACRVRALRGRQVPAS